MDFWNAPLTYRITPKSGPMRSMDRLLDANHALTQDLPIGWLRRPHWATVGKLLLVAAERGDPADIDAVTEALLAAVDSERWMDRLPFPDTRSD